MRARIERLWPLLALALVVAIVLFSFPYLASAYHLEASGRELADNDQAVEHLHRAIAWDPDNAQALRLLAKMYRVEREWGAAIESLEHYIALRPRNPLAHLELAETYEYARKAMDSMYRIDLVAALDTEVAGQEGFVETALLRESPDWEQNPSRINVVLSPQPEERPNLIMHSPARITYGLALPLEPTALCFEIGIDPRALHSPGNGVSWKVMINDEQVFLEYVDRVTASRWLPRSIDLTPWAGQEVSLVLAAEAGPAADTTGAWAFWGTPQILDRRLPCLATEDLVEKAVREWREVGQAADTLLKRGRALQEAGQFDDAQDWYRRATWLEPDFGDAWYHLGLGYEEQQRWQEALIAYERAGTAKRSEEMGRSSPYYRRGVVYQWRLESTQSAEALAAYDIALELDDFASQAQAADCHFNRGEVLTWLKAEPAEYMAEFQKAIELYPEHLWAHLHLGIALYQTEHDVEKAERMFRRAAEIEPDSATAWYQLGELYRNEGRADEAIEMYRTALEIDPTFIAAEQALTALLDGS